MIIFYAYNNRGTKIAKRARISYTHPDTPANYSGIILLAEVKAIDIFLKKVSPKHITDLQQQLSINGRPIKYLIDISAITIELARQPYYRTLLGPEFALNGFTNKNLIHRRIT